MGALSDSVRFSVKSVGDDVKFFGHRGYVTGQLSDGSELLNEHDGKSPGQRHNCFMNPTSSLGRNAQYVKGPEMDVKAKPGRMSAAAFNKALNTLDLSQRASARLFGVNQTTAARWARGEQDIPGAVEVALKLMVRFKVDPKTMMEASDG